MAINTRWEEILSKLQANKFLYDGMLMVWDY